MGKHRKPEKPFNGDSKPGKAPDRRHAEANAAAKPQSNRNPGRKDSAELLLQPRPDWHATDLAKITVPDTAATPSPKVLQSVQEYANSLLASEAKLYADTHLKASSSHKFMTTVMTSGTWSDKISALTLVVQESPIHTQKELEDLLSMASKRSRDNALMALAAIKDLLAQGLLLPSHRKLRYITKQPELLAALLRVKATWSSQDPLPNGLTKQHLMLWAYEDWLKRSYFEMLQVLESWCSDTVENSRMRAVTYVFELLKEKPEQEENLLRLLVNKLGDTSKKIASRASYLLLQLQTSHPQMRSIIIAAIESEILLKPGQSTTAKYYASITLNQTILSTSDPESASKLLDVYFGVFVSILNKAKNNRGSLSKDESRDEKAKGGSKKRKRSVPEPTGDADKAEGELDDKIVGQVLTGIHRAFPYCKSESARFEEHIDTMFRITHSSNFNTSIQALQLIQQISSSLSISNDRYMRTLYESLLDPRLLSSSKQTMYLNLLYRSLKADASMRRVKAFVKRITQMMTLHEPPFICAALYLIHELEETFPSLQTMFNEPEIDADEDDEVIRDVPDSDDERAVTANGAQPNGVDLSRKHVYDPRKRDPNHSNADKACLWEMPPWTMHYHPSATLFARSLMYPSKPAKQSKGGRQVSSFPPKPDPTSHTLMHFLDRFAYRNPKAPTDNKAGPPARGTSLMQPALASTNVTDTLFTRSRHGDMLPFPPSSSAADSAAAPLTANSEAFWSRQVSQIPADEVFFHRYFSDVGPKRKASAAKRESGPTKKRGAADDDEWDEDIGANEDEIWKALAGSRPELEEPEDDEDESEGSVGEDFAAEMEDDGGDDDGVELNLESDDEMDDFDEDDGMQGGDGQFADDDDDVDSEGDLVLDDEDGMFSEEEEEEIGEQQNEGPPSKKQKGEDKQKKGKKRLSNLPTFASADDYARMIDEAEGSGLDEG